MIRHLRQKDKINFIDYCLRYSKCKDFYLFENKNRLFLNDSKICEKMFNSIIKKNGICYVADDGQFRGILLIVKDSQIPSKNYLKIAADNYRTIDNLFRFLNWHFSHKLFIRIHKTNIVWKLAKKYKFSPVAFYDNEVLLCRKLNLYRRNTYNGKRNNS